MCGRQKVNIENIRNLLQNHQIGFSPIGLADIKKISNIVLATVRKTRYTLHIVSV